MTFPKFLKFEETREVEFGTLDIGTEFCRVNDSVSRTKTSYVAGANSVSSNWNLHPIDSRALVTIARPLETKPLDECKPGDVVRVDGITCDACYVIKGSEDSEYIATVTLDNNVLLLLSRGMVATVIGKAVCDG